MMAVVTVFCIPSQCFINAEARAKTPLTPAQLNERTQEYARLLSTLQYNYVDTLDIESLIKTGLRALLANVDPYTEYYDTENLEDLTTVASGNYGGIGSGIMARDSLVILSDPYYGKPANMAGVRHGDIILQIDDYVIPTKDINVSDISKRLRGNAGTHVRIKVRRPWLPDGADSIFVFDIERKKVTIDPVPFTTVFDDGIAYIEVSTFNRNTADEIRNALSAIVAREGKNLKGVIVDLRENGGGLLESAVNLLSLFLDRGTMVVETRYRDGSVETYKTRKSPVDTKIPLVVMVNGNTASASEIVSGAIQDLDRGVIMGRRTFGKGLVQSSAPLGYDSVLKYTVGKYYLPSGRLVQALDYRDADGKPTLIPDSLTNLYHTAGGREVRDGRGVSPDVEIPAENASTLTWQLYTDNWVSDYANRYRNTHDESPDFADTLFMQTVFEDFKDFVNPEKLNYGIASKKALEFLRDAIKVEGLDTENINQAVDSLETLMKHDLAHELEANRKEIMQMLETEIAERYLTPEQISALLITKDTDVKAARELLLDPDRYKEILNGQKK